MPDSSKSGEDALVTALEGCVAARRDLNFVFASITNAEQTLTNWRLSLKGAREKEAKARQVLMEALEVE